jgi:glyoxylase-like metal-dependent hydrolase (beta-lactamase superfamily II)
MPINRREFLAVSSATLATLPLARLLAGAQAAAPPATAFTPVRRNIGIFTGQGGTIGWLANKSGVVLIDTQYPASARICLDGLKQRTGHAPDLVINTHHHIDHTGGNGIFRAEARRIVAQARVPELQRRVAAETPNAAEPVVADATFEQTWTEHAGDETLTARHYGPGHTAGDAIVHFEKADVVHMGDLLWNELHPRVDRPAGASIATWITTLDTIVRTMPRNTIFIAGHARPGAPATTDRAALVQLRRYFEAALSYVRKGIADGRARDAFATVEVLPGFEQFKPAGTVLTLGGVLRAAYDELTAAHPAA